MLRRMAIWRYAPSSAGESRWERRRNVSSPARWNRPLPIAVAATARAICAPRVAGGTSAPASTASPGGLAAAGPSPLTVSRSRAELIVDGAERRSEGAAAVESGEVGVDEVAIDLDAERLTETVEPRSIQ